MSQAGWSPGGQHRKRPSSAADDSPPKVLCPQPGVSPHHVATAQGQHPASHQQQHGPGVAGYTSGYVQSPLAPPPYRQQQLGHQTHSGSSSSRPQQQLFPGQQQPQQQQQQVPAVCPTPWTGQHQQWPPNATTYPQGGPQQQQQQQQWQGPCAQPSWLQEAAGSSQQQQQQQQAGARTTAPLMAQPQHAGPAGRDAGQQQQQRARTPATPHQQQPLQQQQQQQQLMPSGLGPQQPHPQQAFQQQQQLPPGWGVQQQLQPQQQLPPRSPITPQQPVWPPQLPLPPLPQQQQQPGTGGPSQAGAQPGPHSCMGPNSGSAPASGAANSSAARSAGAPNSSANFAGPQPQQQQQQLSPPANQGWQQSSPQAPYGMQQQQQQQQWQHSPQPGGQQWGNTWHGALQPGSGPTGHGNTTTTTSSSSRAWRPSIAGRVHLDWELLHAASAGAIQVLSQRLGEPEWHVQQEVTRLQAWLQLTFHLRLVLEQFMVLDFVSLRTLQQLPHLPPHQLSTLDSWLGKDLHAYQAAAAAAAAAGFGARHASGSAAVRLNFSSAPVPGNRPALPGGSNNSSSSGSRAAGVPAAGLLTSWAASCGGWECADPVTWGRVPPSKVLEELISERRLVWVPLGTAAAAAGTAAAAARGGGSGSSGTQAAAAAAAATGYYKWQHGPVDAWLSTDAATKQARAEELQQQQHHRNQGKLLLNLETYLGRNTSGAGSSSCGRSVGQHQQQQQQQQGVGGVYFEWRYRDLSHKSSCHLQRHPLLAAHDRLIRVAVDRSGLLYSSSSSVMRVSREERQAALRRAVEEVLTHGVVLAGRRYSRLVQKDVGQDGESLWFLATESLAPEDTAAWPPTNPAAARQLLGGFASLSSVSKQCARGALLVSNTLPLKVQARNIIYIPDVVGPTDRHGRPLQPTSSSNIGSSSSNGGPGLLTSSSSSLASSADAADELVMTDGSGFISQDLAGLVPAVSSGELLAAVWGQGVVWPNTPLQVRLFDPHLGGVIAKGTLLPLNSSALPPGTIVLRQSQVKAPAGKAFWTAWTQHWQQLLIWAHQRHTQAVQIQQQQQAWTTWPPQQQQQQQQALEGSSWLGPANSSSTNGAAAAGTSPAGGFSTSAGAFEAAAQAAAAAAAGSRRGDILRCFNAQDQPWLQQLWYIHDAAQLQTPPVGAAAAAATAGGQHGGVSSAPPARPGCPCGSNSSSSGSASGGVCGCAAVLEVVNRPPDSSGRNPDLKVNKNLLLLLHGGGVPLEVPSRWLQIEQHKLEHIDTSWADALAAAKEGGATDVVYKLEALIGVVLPCPGAAGATGLGAPAAAAAAAGCGDGGAVAAITANFRPDLALKQELHDIKVKMRQRLANLQLPVPTPADAARAVAAGVVAGVDVGGSSSIEAFNTGSYGTRQFGLPDPTCGAVPEGCVAISPELMRTAAQGVTEVIIYRDPGIHPGDVRRVRLMPYPPELLQLIPPNLHGAIFLPSVGPSSLAASLSGGDYDGDLFLLLWEPGVLASFRQADPPPYIAPSKSSASSSANTSAGSGPGISGSNSSSGGRWSIPEGAGWADVEQQLTAYYSHCVDVGGVMGEAHNIWELLADRFGAGHRDCQDLAALYYRALDAPKTGVRVEIPHQFKLHMQGALPPWHSRRVKEEARALTAGMGQRSRQPPAADFRQCVSKVCRPLWVQVHDLPALDYDDPCLLDVDDDLVLQAGPDALTYECMRPFLEKWERLLEVWTGAWRERLQAPPGKAPSKAAHRAVQAEKMELRNSLVARLQQELFTGAELLTDAEQFAAATQAAASQMVGAQGAALSSSTVSVWTTPLTLINASACYQATYMRARAMQAMQSSKSAKQRADELERYGYAKIPRVAMPWRIAGQYLRLLKVLRPLLQAPRASRQLGSLQHPFLSAALIAQQHSAAAQRRNRGPAAGLGADAAAAAELQGLAL